MRVKSKSRALRPIQPVNQPVDFPKVFPVIDETRIVVTPIQTSVWPGLIGRIVELAYLTILALFCTGLIVIATSPELFFLILEDLGVKWWQTNLLKD